MKIIFLDIDGVLNSYASGRPVRPDNADELSYADYMSYEIDKEKVLLFNEIIKKSGAKVVISSSWRFKKRCRVEAYKGFKPKEMQYILNSRGFTGRVISQTKVIESKRFSGHVMRGEEIHDWLENHPNIKEFVILDDCSIAYDYQDQFKYLLKRFVNTDPGIGLTSNDVDLAIRILNGHTLYGD